MDTNPRYAGQELDRKQTWMATVVEPTLARVMEALAVARPTSNIGDFITSVASQSNAPVPTGAVSDQPSPEVLKEYFSTYVDPLIHKLMHTLVVSEPTDVTSFITDFCESEPDPGPAVDIPDEKSPEPTSKSVSTSTSGGFGGAITRGALLKGQYFVVVGPHICVCVCVCPCCPPHPLCPTQSMAPTDEGGMRFRAYDPATSTALLRVVPPDAPGLAELLTVPQFAGVLKHLDVEDDALVWV